MTAREVLQKIEDEGAVPVAQIVERAGLTYDAWWRWKTGRRNPSVSSRRRIAAALRTIGHTQARLADLMDATAGEG